MAVGYYSGAPGPQGGTSAVWDGASWSTVPVANVDVYGAEELMELNSVSCTSPDNCLAVGYSGKDLYDVGSALAERWDGRVWSVVRTTDVPGAAMTVLDAVSCTSANSCMATGTYKPDRSNTYLPMAERLTPAGFGRTTSLPLALDFDQGLVLSFEIPNVLTSVSCPTTREVCRATFYDPSVASWDGLRWTANVAKGPAPLGSSPGPARA
jgi:hypothetical protein